MNQSRTLSFSRFRIDKLNQELWCDGELVEIQPKTFEVLLYLASNPQRLVTRRELLESFGPGTRILSLFLRRPPTFGKSANCSVTAPAHHAI